MSAAFGGELWWSGIVQAQHDEILALHMKVEQLREELAEARKALRRANEHIRGMLEYAASEVPIPNTEGWDL